MSTETVLKKLEAYDKEDEGYLSLIAEYSIQKDAETGEVFKVSGEFKENMGGDEWIHLFSFESNWELNVILEFKGIYETGNVYGLENISNALQLVSYIARHEIDPSGVYMHEDEIRRIDNSPIWNNYELKLIIQ